MTCIVGIEHDGVVTIGADSASSDGLTLQILATSKLFRVGGYLFGFTTSWRMGQLLQYSLSIGPPEGWDVDRWMATSFIDAVRQTLKDGGFAKTKNDAEEGGSFLVGVAGRLYMVASDYQVSHAAHGYDAVGSGARVAMGSLHTTSSMDDLSPGVRCGLALEAAAAHTTSVAPPFRLQELPGGQA